MDAVTKRPEYEALVASIYASLAAVDATNTARVEESLADEDVTTAYAALRHTLDTTEIDLTVMRRATNEAALRWRTR